MGATDTVATEQAQYVRHSQALTESLDEVPM
jgi:hypothetical protein